MTLGSAHDKAVHKHAKHKNGEIVLFKKFDEGKAVYKGKMEKQAIKDFIATHQLKVGNPTYHSLNILQTQNPKL